MIDGHTHDLNPSFFKFEHWRISTVWISHIIRLGQYISKFVTYTQFVEPIPIIINRRISLEKKEHTCIQWKCLKGQTILETIIAEIIFF